MIANLILVIWINVDQYNNNYHHSIGKTSIHADYNALTEKTEANSKSPKFKFNDRVRFTKYKNICW